MTSSRMACAMATEGVVTHDQSHVKILRCSSCPDDDRSVAASRSRLRQRKAIMGVFDEAAWACSTPSSRRTAHPTGRSRNAQPIHALREMLRVTDTEAREALAGCWRRENFDWGRDEATE